ncbi:MAG: hypothetical protein AB7O38_25425, partial [Pirellulaceae bacterium]
CMHELETLTSQRNSHDFMIRSQCVTVCGIFGRLDEAYGRGDIRQGAAPARCCTVARACLLARGPSGL